MKFEFEALGNGGEGVGEGDGVRSRREAKAENKTFTTLFTDATANMVNHLGFRLGALGSGDQNTTQRLLRTLWKYDGKEEEPDPVFAAPEMHDDDGPWATGPMAPHRPQ
mmetsp:Transcript_5318/g.14819  ORF Transcript_5318/g.14819 Transcript_5318/m.14819 type:complete len:109 (+) Transcript_5318:168-494(+)